MRDPTNADKSFDAAPGDRSTSLRPMPFLIALPFTVLEAIGRAGFYAAWHLLYFVACAFRAFTGFLVLAGIVMLPVSLGVFVNPNAAPMPWWFFLSSADVRLCGRLQSVPRLVRASWRGRSIRPLSAIANGRKWSLAH